MHLQHCHITQYIQPPNVLCSTCAHVEPSDFPELVSGCSLSFLHFMLRRQKNEHLLITARMRTCCLPMVAVNADSCCGIKVFVA